MNRGQVMTILRMQDGMNRLVNADWLTAGYPWLRAVVLEGAEAMEHHGWKWWKKQTPDIVQLRIELVDIFHFAVSDTLVMYGGNYTPAADHIEKSMLMDNDIVNFDRTEYRLAGAPMLHKIELMISLAATRRFSFPLFRSIMEDAGMSWTDLYVGYVSKNVLNTFRQRHGYKEGTYIKNWDGAEDNVRLASIVSTLDVTDPQFGDVLYDKLRLRYEAIAGK